MFTDGPVTPLHVESLLTFMVTFSGRKISRDEIRNAFQPPALTDKQDQSKYAISAAVELELLCEQADKQLGLTEYAKGDVSECLLRSLDRRVLENTDVEYYLALFYSYMLGLNSNPSGVSREEWVSTFNRDVFNNKEQTNQFNTTKLTGIHRWLVYIGLGWSDQSGEFTCNPYFRLKRNLAGVFDTSKKLAADDFVTRIATVCPELDGGEIFLRANQKYDPGEKMLTLGLSHALFDLHVDGVIALHCPKDSDGWSISRANPAQDSHYIAADRISFVELLPGVNQ